MWKSWKVPRRVIVVCIALFAVLVAEFVVTAHVIDRDRVAIQRSFADDRLRQLERAIRGAESELETIAEDLAAASRFLSQDPLLVSAEARLAALLMIRPAHYRALAIVGSEGVVEFEMLDAPLEKDARVIHQMLEETGRAAAARPPGDVVVSDRAPDTGNDGEALRAFAMSLESPVATGVSAGRAVVLLVDVSPIVAPVRVLSGDSHTSLLFTAADGTPEPITSSSIQRQLASEVGSGLDSLQEAMTSSKPGSLRFSMTPDGAKADAIASHGQIEMRGEPVWKVATITSMEVLEDRQRKTGMRLHLISGVVATLIIAFGAQFVVASRREATLSERLEVARKLAHLHEKSNKILASIPSGVMLLSRDDSVMQINETLAEWHPPAQVGRPFDRVFADADPEARESLRETIRASQEAGRTVVELHEASTLFGDPRQLRISVVPLSADTPDERAALIFDDLSEIHALRSHLLRAEKLATVGILSAGIAHEVGTPLGVIRGSAEFLLNTTEQGALGQETLQTIIGQIDRISEVITGVLDFSREHSPSAVSTSLQQVVDEVLKLLRYEKGRQGVGLDVQIPADLPMLNADPNQLQQVLINLLVNAFDASDDSGTVRIIAHATSDQTSESAPRVEIRVEDEGHGIPEDRIHQVFDPFFTTKKRGKGTGLGLPIVARIVENHDGQIDIRSRPGEGTTIILTWPVFRGCTSNSNERVDA